MIVMMLLLLLLLFSKGALGKEKRGGIWTRERSGIHACMHAYMVVVKSFDAPLFSFFCFFLRS
jgi:hypothetical protein